MRRLWLCVLMMPLLLTACGGEREGNEGEMLALALRGDYLAMECCTGTAEITADYGQRIYRYRMDFQWDEEQTQLTLTAPDTVAGITARLSAGEGSRLEYDGVMLETGELPDCGLTPISALPAILDTIRTGYLDSCVLEEAEDGGRVLRILSRDPALEPGQGVETTVWFEPETGRPVRGEICSEGFCVIQCVFFDFNKE